MKLRVTTRIRQETFAIESRLDSERWGYGDRFPDDLNAAVKEILSQPRRFPQCEDYEGRYELRECYLERFEYRLVYRIVDEDTIQLLALIHAHARQSMFVLDDDLLEE